MRLNAEQQERVESALWVVNAVLKRKGVSGDSELRSIGYLTLCICATKFDESRGVKWETYAYRSVLLKIIGAQMTEREKQRLQVTIGGKVCTQNMLDGLEVGSGERRTDKEFLMLLKSILAPLESQILELRLQGYLRRQICDKLQLPVKKYKGAWRRIKAKARTLRQMLSENFL